MCRKRTSEAKRGQMREVLPYVAQEFEKLVSFYLVGEIIQYISQRMKRVVANPIE
jgi:hypothetical protein